MSLQRVSSVLSGLKQWYNEINPATLTGAIDVIVVEQADGTFVSSPFHVRFGKLGVLKAKEKIVDLEVNDIPVDIHMKLDDNGAAFFVEGLDESEHDELPAELATSPIPTEDPSLSQTPKWDENQRETVNRSLLKEFEAEQTNEDTTDDATAINRNQNKLSKRKRKKNYKKHSRSGSKASLKEFFLENATTPVPHSDNIVAPNEAVTSSSDAETRVRHKSSTETSLLLSRLPIEPEIMDSIATDDQEIKQIETEPPRSSLPINIERQFSYFSEPEISPGTSPMGSRPGSPVMSDTEFETGKRGSISTSGGGSGKKEAEQSWEWGQLPSSTTPTHPKTNKNEKNNKDGVLGDSEEPGKSGSAGWGIFGGWGLGAGKKSNKEEDDEQPGVYLDDLKNDDPEMLNIYLGRNRTRSGRDHDTEDAESGTGPSLPMSPHSVVGAIGFNPVEIEEPHINIEISNCGGFDEFSPLLFEQSKVSFDDFVIKIETTPNILTDPNLVVKIGDVFHKWDTAAPIIMSHVLYGRALPQDLIKKLNEQSSIKQSSITRGITNKTPTPEKTEKVEGQSEPERERKRSSWWPFSAKKPEAEDALTSTPSKIETSEDPDDRILDEVVVGVTSSDENQNSRKRRNDTTTSSSSEAESDHDKSKEKWKKTLKLPKDAIKNLNLKKGSNEIQFSVTTAYQGTTKCYCHVYLWHHSDKIVISDIDGTITKSDVLGHVFPMIGRDWAQSGVASLFTKIVNNGYHIVYLSARAIGQASITKEYLASVKQGEVNLPDGPIFLNPTSLVNAFHREVIEKKPEAFKIACLRDIRSLFPEATNPNPFYAGYGNRVNDVWAYQAVGIPMSRIFTINPRGELRHELTNAFQTSYEGQGSEVDRLYPALEVRRYLSASLAQASEIPMSLPMTLPMSISRNYKISQSAAHFDSESGIWTPPVGQNDHEHSDHEDLDNIDNIEDIFTLSGSSSGSSTRPDPTESNEFNLDTDQDFDEESLYSDALSRKQSLVW